MRDYEIESEFSNETTERKVLATVGAGVEWAKGWQAKLEPAWFWHHAGLLESGEVLEGICYAEEREFLEALQELTQLERKRHVARVQKEAWESLFDRDKGWELAVGVLETGLLSLRGQTTKAELQSGPQLIAAVLAEAERKRQKRRDTGKAVIGITTGFSKLDLLINGWYAGLHVIAAGPGVGKTTLCLQFAWEALRSGYPVLYVSYENAPQNLMLKILCARAGVSAAEVERGYGDVEKLQEAEAEGSSYWDQLRVMEGDGRLRMAAVEQAMRALLEKHKASEGLIIFDYLQRGAHGIGYDQLRQNVSQLTGELRETAMRLSCPVIAISSQNRSGGDYGRGGSGALDSLKESGDLEYGADTVSLLFQPGDITQPPAPARELELKIAKNRFGAVGSLRVVFRPDTGIFREKA